MTNKILLLSIRPEHAENIFAGIKKVELRRMRPKVEKGDWVWVYVSTPVQSLLGAFQVDRVVSDTPRRLWKLVQQEASITRCQFDDYYEGAETGHGIFLAKIKKLATPIHLAVLRTVWKEFHPPQSFRYLTSTEIMEIESLTKILGKNRTPIR